MVGLADVGVRQVRVVVEQLHRLVHAVAQPHQRLRGLLGPVLIDRDALDGADHRGQGDDLLAEGADVAAEVLEVVAEHGVLDGHAALLGSRDALGPEDQVLELALEHADAVGDQRELAFRLAQRVANAHCLSSSSRAASPAGAASAAGAFAEGASAAAFFFVFFFFLAG